MKSWLRACPKNICSLNERNSPHPVRRVAPPLLAVFENLPPPEGNRTRFFVPYDNPEKKTQKARVLHFALTDGKFFTSCSEFLENFIEKLEIFGYFLIIRTGKGISKKHINWHSKPIFEFVKSSHQLQLEFSRKLDIFGYFFK